MIFLFILLMRNFYHWKITPESWSKGNMNNIKVHLMISKALCPFFQMWCPYYNSLFKQDSYEIDSHQWNNIFMLAARNFCFFLNELLLFHKAVFVSN